MNAAWLLPHEDIYQMISELKADVVNNPQSKVENVRPLSTQRLKKRAKESGLEL
jgi:hypothetical protein